MWRLPGLLFDLVLCGELNQGLRAMIGRLVEVCRKRGLEVNAGNIKVMILNGEEGCVLDVSGTDEARSSRRVAGEGGLELPLILGICSSA